MPLKDNVNRLLHVRGLTQAQLSSRLGITPSELAHFLDAPPARKATFVKKIADQLLVPDFFLYSEFTPVPSSSLVDFRLATPSPKGYSRRTLRWIDLGHGIQRAASQVGRFRPEKTMSSNFPKSLPIARAAAKFRDLISLTEQTQFELPDARALFTFLRRNVEQFEVFVLQLSFPTDDGVGFCLTGNAGYDVITVNTYKQNYPRRLFTLAHELYHCILNQTGMSDPFVIKNDIERKCNRFAVELLAPEALVNRAAERTIHSRSFSIEEVQDFAALTKLSLHASVIRLVEIGRYGQSALSAWSAYVADRGDPDFVFTRGGRRQEDWKYRLARYGFKFAELFGEAKGRGFVDDYDLYRISGIKPKYQDDYLRKSRSATLEDTEDEEDA